MCNSITFNNIIHCSRLQIRILLFWAIIVSFVLTKENEIEKIMLTSNLCQFYLFESGMLVLEFKASLCCSGFEVNVYWNSKTWKSDISVLVFCNFSNVISVGDRRASVPPQHTREEPLQEQHQQTAGSTQILILLPDGSQRLVNLDVPQGSCSLEEIFEQVRHSKFAHFWHVFRSTWFEFWLGHQLSWLRSFVGFLSPSTQATHCHISVCELGVSYLWSSTWLAAE
jgi:hypothetical protein